MNVFVFSGKFVSPGQSRRGATAAGEVWRGEAGGASEKCLMLGSTYIIPSFRNVILRSLYGHTSPLPTNVCNGNLASCSVAYTDIFTGVYLCLAFCVCFMYGVDL